MTSWWEESVFKHADITTLKTTSAPGICWISIVRDKSAQYPWSDQG
jgi:hypothetical protein